MGRSYPKNPSTTSRTPPQWTDQIRHKFCGALDMGRNGKPNKVHRCEACLAIKARQSKWRDGPDNKKAGTREKIGWHAGNFGQAGGDEGT